MYIGVTGGVCVCAGKVGQVFHPEQDRIISVRECARAQVTSRHGYEAAADEHPAILAASPVAV